jgi:hypothetical protein
MNMHNSADYATCTGCGASLPTYDFYRATGGGRRARCRSCTRADTRERRHRPPPDRSIFSPRQGRKPHRGDPRYGTGLWQRTRKQVVTPGAVCWVRGCTATPTVADHIRPVYPGMPDSEFFGLWNLRPSCRIHNLARAGEALAGEVQPEKPRGLGLARPKGPWSW